MGVNPEEDFDHESSPLLNSVGQKPWLSEPNLFPPLKGKNYGTDSSPSQDDPEKLVRSRKISGTGSKPAWQRYVGLILGIVASVFLSLTTLFAKLLIDYHAFTKSMFRFLGILIPSIPIMLYMKHVQKLDLFESIWPLNQRTKLITFGVLFIRAFFGEELKTKCTSQKNQKERHFKISGCTASILQFYALDFIAIGDVSLVSFTTPVFVTVLAYFVLKEKCGISSVFAAFVSLIGIGVISRPPILSGEETMNMDTTVRISSKISKFPSNPIRRGPNVKIYNRLEFLWHLDVWHLQR